MVARRSMCSVQWDALGAPAWGTAPHARWWLALEQRGAWGRDAITESSLDADLGRTLARACSAAGGRLILIRDTGHHPWGGYEPQVFLAGGPMGRPWLLGGRVAGPDELLRLPFAALGEPEGEQAARAALPPLTPAAGVLLVCTNGRRDTCCAVRGREVARQAAARRPGLVWECSHAGGHRFAPTGVLLPSGLVLGRLDADLAVAAVDAAVADQIPAAALGPTHYRGRSQLVPQAQAAEAWVRRHIGATALDAVEISGEWPELSATVGDERWGIHVESQVVGRAKMSCRDEPEIGHAFAVERRGR